MEAQDTAELMEQKTHDDKNQNRSALTISILAMVLAIASLGGSNAMKEATQENILAANAYAFYQAKNIRQTSFKLAAAGKAGAIDWRDARRIGSDRDSGHARHGNCQTASRKIGLERLVQRRRSGAG